VPFCSSTEVSPAECAVPLRLAPDAGSSTGYYLYFERIATATGYNLYIGTIGSWYSHGGMGIGRVCGLSVTDLGTGEMRAEVSPFVTDQYYLVTAFADTLEGPSGFDSSGMEIPRAQSTCAP
jgi:hypothetical protein